MSTPESLAKDAQDELTYEWLVEIGATCQLCGVIIPGAKVNPDEEGYGFCSDECDWTDQGGDYA